MNEEESEYEDNLGTPRAQSPPPASLKIRIIKPKLPLESSMIPNHRASRSSTRPPDRPVRETRLRSRVSYDDATPTDDSSPRHVPPPRTTRSGRNAPSMYVDDFPDDEDDDDIPPRRLGKKRMSSTRSTRRSGDTQDFVVDDRDDELSDRPYPLRSQVRKPPTPNHRTAPRRQPSRRKNDDDGDGEFQLTEKSELETDDGPSHDDDAPITSPSPSPGPTRRGNMHVNHSPRGYTLRPQRKPVNYEIPPPLDVDLFADAPNTNGRSKGPGRAARAAFARTGSQGFLGTFATLPPPPPINNDSDSDDPNNPTAKPLSGPTPSGSGGGLIGGGSLTAGDLAAAAGTPANFGKVSKDSALADTDPLGVNVNVTFDEVGGLDDHIASLKEMITLPLLYPEIFQQFKITPPRGVLFHGPPGTGKTLLARALAASSRSGGRDISFFMRKGADILSKWVGEAERQLRLLFEEARACQPSIIFFDEIDGLAPVRSSKQDQIHASIVSTLLALMDGMDGRGQVIVIGATNRPDAVDPALRRPGRFDREFYFPLPSLTARQRILRILTKGWEGWDGDKGEPMIQVLAEATKGYAGADLRALATEATLNAVQRTYPQIYKSVDRLVVKPESIRVAPRDFLISVKKLIPSSARSTASVAAPLPVQIIPLLRDRLERVKDLLNRILPISKQRNALEEAEWEPEKGEDGGFEREMRLQAMETLRLHRPRILIHGPPGMGQTYLGAAALHHLEGFHIQSLDLGSLLSDSTRSVEATIVQLFVEAKRHKPSVIYIPSLVGWSAAISDVARTTVREMLDTLAPTDPVLLFGVVNGSLDEVPRDIRDWFGYSRETRVFLCPPTPAERSAFFHDVLAEVSRPPNEFPDAIRRRKRVLEKLPIAPPLPPRQPTAVEIASQLEKDRQTIVTLTVRLGPILSDLKKRYRRVTRSVEARVSSHTVEICFLSDLKARTQDAQEAVRSYDVAIEATLAPEQPVQNEVHIDVDIVDAPVADGLNNSPTNGLDPLPNGDIPSTTQSAEDAPSGSASTIPAPLVPPAAIPPPRPPQLKVYDVDLDKMHQKLYEKGYLAPGEFLKDLSRIVHNTRLPPCNMEHAYKAHQMYSEAEAIVWDPQFKLECERMSVREKARRAAVKAEAEKNAPPKDATASKAGMNVNGNAEPYPAGTRRSARAIGEKPELASTDPVLLERTLKRQRGDGETPPVSGEDAPEDQGSPMKRPRLSLTDEDADGEAEIDADIAPSVPRLGTADTGVGSAVDPLSSDIPMDGISYSRPEEPTKMPSSADQTLRPPIRSMDLSRLLQPVDPRPNLPSAQNADPSPANTMAPPELPVTPSSPRPSRSPSPLIPVPAFEVLPNQVSALHRLVEDRTSDLTIEQLEQLRAMCLDCVWRHRSEWNRTDMVKEMIEVVHDFIEQVHADDSRNSP